MDLRTERTKKSITNAFLELRTEKTLEKITVKELAEKAFINKATFYLHYKDIYDLSEQLENELIDRMLSKLLNPEDMVIHPKKASENLAEAFISQNQLIDILFSGNREAVFITKVEMGIKSRIYAIYPEYETDLEKDIMLTYLIQGGVRAFSSKSKTADTEKLIEIVGNISEKMLR